MSEPIEFRASRGATALAVLGSILFVALGVILMRQPDGGAKVVGGLTIATFGVFAVLGLQMLLKPAQSVIIDSVGLTTDAIPGARRVSIPWSKVDRIELGVVQHQQFLQIFLKDESVLVPASGFGERLMSANRQLVGTAAVIAPASFGKDRDRLVEVIQQHCPKP